ncbi:MAG: phospho-N-acetylmuramoyl-pentapeptide-transferase [Anaerolineales bacterium]
MNGTDATFALTLASIAFLMTVIWGGPLLEVLRRFNIGETIRIEGPRTHLTKLGTPTMGGLLFILPVLLITALLNVVNLARPVTGRSILLPLAVLVATGLLGALDDWIGIRGRRMGGVKGLRARNKFLVQIAIALWAGGVLFFALDVHSLALPGYPRKVDLGLFYIPVAAFIIVATSNAVNLTDGLDGLAGLISATAFVAYGLIALLQGQTFLVRFCFTVVGALFAFLWYNVHPAQLFMGDTGSLAIGALLAVVALMTGQWLLLPVIAIVPVAETLSTMIQVASAQLSRRFLGRDMRPFKMSPLHNHFVLVGWSETQIVQRFWLVSLLATMIGIALALL